MRPSNVHAAGLVLQRAADAVHQRRLARAVRPDQAEALARRDVEIDAVERDEAAEALADLVDLEERRGHQRSLARRRSCTSPTMPFGAMITKATSRTPTISRLTADEMVTRATSWIEPSRIAPTSGPIQRAGAADHRHGDRVDRVGEPEGRRRLDVGDVVGERRAGHAHQGAGHRGGDQLQPQRRHAAGFGGELVVADGGKAEAEPRALDQCARSRSPATARSSISRNRYCM